MERQNQKKYAVGRFTQHTSMDKRVNVEAPCIFLREKVRDQTERTGVVKGLGQDTEKRIYLETTSLCKDWTYGCGDGLKVQGGEEGVIGKYGGAVWREKATGG